jgi:hypothetical protein
MVYNKKVTLLTSNGSFSAKLVTSNNEIYSGKNLTYTGTVKDTVVTLVLNKSQVENGTYTITVPNGFVQDSFMNTSTSQSVVLKKDSDASGVLQAPKSVAQSPIDPSILYITFDNMLDLATAQNVANYYITGTTIISAELTDNTTTGAIVKLTLAKGSVAATAVYPITISNLIGYQHSYTAMTTYKTTLVLNENKAPALVNNPVYSFPRSITLTFDESITGTPSFKVYQNNIELPCTSILSGTVVIISLDTDPTMNITMRIVPTQNNSITDMAGNAITTALNCTVVPR